MGNSKATTAYLWLELLNTNLTAATGDYWYEWPARYAVAGYTVADMKTYVDANLAATRTNPAPTNIVCTLGTVELSALPVEATLKTNYASIIDSFRAKWPGVPIYLIKPWRQGFAANANTFAGWIDDIVAGYGSGVYVGHDERGWLEGGDDGATMTSDGVHYSNPAGIDECAAQWQNVLGY